MGGELHHCGQPWCQVVRRGPAQREISGALPDSNIGHGPREYAGRFRFWIRVLPGAIATF